MKKIFFTFLLILSSCTTRNSTKAASFKALIDLEESTKIIRALLSQNKLSKVLEKHDPEQLDLMLNNFSPAQMAFEAEVLTTTIPLVAVYYFKNSPEEQEFLKQLDQLALENNDKIKFVIIEMDKLFSLAQSAEIEAIPAIIFSKNREILEKITADITIDIVRKKVLEYIKWNQYD